MMVMMRFANYNILYPVFRVHLVKHTQPLYMIVVIQCIFFGKGKKYWLLSANLPSFLRELCHNNILSYHFTT